MKILEKTDYLRQRNLPQPGEALYLCLSDLEQAMRRFASQEPLAILDLGCGGSPYRGLFPKANYRRADLAGQAGEVDYVIGTDGRVPAADGSFDVVLSTQVLEHVPEPQAYLREARRVLKTGGRLILTTHGTFDEHGCPADYRRWTLGGLERELCEAGFEVRETFKLTTGLRALHALLDYWMLWDRTPRGWGTRLLYKVARAGYRGVQALLHRISDRVLRSCRVVHGPAPEHRLYIGILIVAVKSE